jgi:hypothetical protein
MPLDAHCPKCRHVFPITEAKSVIGVSCPNCGTELTAEFRRRATPEPGQHPYELVVSAGRPVGAPPPTGVKKHRLPDDDEGETRSGGGGGGGAIVVFAGVGALVLALGGLVTTGYLLFSNLDTSDSTISKLSSEGSSKSSTKGGTTKGATTKGATTPGVPIIPGTGRPKGNTRPGTTPTIPPNFEPFEPPFEKKVVDTFDLKPVAGTHQPISPPAIDPKNPVTVTLPGQVESVTVGGNGRYIVFHIPWTRDLVVFDANRGAIVAKEKMPEPFRLFLAGGQNRVVTCDQGSRILRSYTLPELRKEFDFTSPLFHHPDGIAMGSGVNSPLLITDPFANVALLDLTEKGATVVEGSKSEQPLGLPAQPPNPRAAPSGNVFFFSRGNNRGEKTGVLTASGRKWRTQNIDITAASPSADSRYLLGFGQIIDVASGKRIGNWMGNDGNAVWYVGGTSGRAFLRLAQTQQNGKSAVVVTAHNAPQEAENDKPAAVLGILPETEGLIDWIRGVALPLDQHLFFIPDAKLLVTLPASKDKLILRQVEMK